MKKTCDILAIVIISIAPCLKAGSADYSPKTVSELPEIKELSNPFTFIDGSLVQDKEDWQRRRKELKSLFAAYEYGRLPPKPERMTIIRGNIMVDEEAAATIQNFELNLENGERTLIMHMRLTLPRNVTGPVPVVIKSVFGRFGNAAQAIREV